MRKNIEFAEFQDIAKDVLHRVKIFCEENNLRYYLAYGTLLGAVRHGDIIPWDYDIDIMMPRKDFDKFLEMTANKNNPIENTEVYSWINKKEYYLPFVKVCDSRTRLVITKNENPLPFGIWVDIFPLDGALPETEDADLFHDQVRKYVGKASAPYAHVSPLKEQVYRLYAKLKTIWHPSAEYMKKVQDIASCYDYETSENVGVIVSVDLPLARETCPHSVFENVIKLKFGNEEFVCPSDYDVLLKMYYRDYMQLPPEEKRKIPNIKSYWI